MLNRCIGDCKLEDTGFNYTMSLIQGKYKMFILYTLAGFGVVRFNKMKKIHWRYLIQNTQHYAEGLRKRWIGTQRRVSADSAKS